MLWIIIAIFVVLWYFGVIAGRGGSAIHMLLVIAVAVLIYHLFPGRRKAI